MSAKVLFYPERDADGYPPIEVESLWAKQVEGGYELDNIPFYVKGVALGDVVATCRDPGGALVSDRVAKRGGHSTYRILLLAPGPADPAGTIEELRKLGLGVEYDLDILLAVDVPPTLDLEEVESVLFEGVDSGRWELEEGYRAVDPA